MAALIPFRVGSLPVGVPQAAVLQTGQGHHGLGVLRIPPAPPPFDAVGGGLALRLRGAAANLPATAAELWVGLTKLSFA